MYSARRVTFAIGSLIFVVLIGLVFYGYQSFQRDVEALQIAGQEDISWPTGQLELELMRFRAELHAMEAHDGGAASNASVNQRFDIMWSRVIVFQRGRVGERLSSYDLQTEIVARLFATMQAYETRVLTLQPGDRDTISDIDAAFKPFSEELREFSRRVAQGEQQISIDIRTQLRSGAQRTLIILGVATLMHVIALLVILRDARLSRRLADHNQRLAEEATRASLAKSQFLTMMSHELRTPMNGVIGLLALARQSSMSAALNRMLSQAERSANLMIGLLTDILDFSALQSNNMPVQHKTFSLRELADNLRKYDHRVDQPMQVDVEADTPDILLGDEKRLTEIYAHIMGYMLETAGVEGVVLRLSHNGEMLCAAIHYHYTKGDIWYPAMLADNLQQDDDNFATGVVGPTIARGLCDLMKGNINVSPDLGEGGLVSIEIPAAVASIPQINVWLETQSVVTRKLCEVALRDSRIVLMTTESGQQADVILLEDQGQVSDERLRALRESFPSARAIGLGTSAERLPFDQYLDLPIDIAVLRATIIDRLAS